MILWEDHDIKTHDQEITWLFSPIINLLHGMKWTIFVKRSTTIKMELNELENGRFVMKSMEIKNHDA